MGLSLIGRIFHNFEMKLSRNCRLFIGKHEKTIEIIFLIIYFSLQALLVFLVRETIVALIVITFLLFLSFERIFLHIWLDYKKEQIKRTEDIITDDFINLRMLNNTEISRLNKEIEILKRENRILKKKR